MADAEEAGDDGAKPLALAAARGAGDEDVDCFGFGEVDGEEVAVEVDANGELGAADGGWGFEELGLYVGEVDGLAVAALDVDDDTALVDIDVWRC